MTEQTTAPRPLTLDEVHTEATYYGVKVASIGEEGEVLAFTHDLRRAIAAVRKYVRRDIGETADPLAWRQPEWAQVFDHCGCALHAPDPKEAHWNCDCERRGLPPCSDDFAWWSEKCQKDAVNALAVIEFEWSC